MSPIELPSLVPRVTEHWRVWGQCMWESLCSEVFYTGTRRSHSENYNHKTEGSRRTSERVQDDRVLWTELCPLQVYSCWLEPSFPKPLSSASDWERKGWRFPVQWPFFGFWLVFKLRELWQCHQVAQAPAIRWGHYPSPHHLPKSDITRCSQSPRLIFGQMEGSVVCQ